MAVSGVEKKVAEAPSAQQRQIVRSHRPKAGPHFHAVVIGALGIKLLRDAFHEGEIGWPVARVVAGELCRRSDADSIAEAGDGDKIVLVDSGDRRRRQPVADRYRQRIALDGIDWQSNAEIARQNRALRPKREDVDVAPERAPV